MMLYEFKRLVPVIQEYIIHERGIELAKRKGRNRHMVLYFVDSFYVEVSYLPSTHNITMIRSFKTDTFLQPYLEQIDITCLLL